MTNQSAVTRFFSVIIEPQTYLNLLYLLLSFPLGIGYFVFLVVGFSVGIGLLIVWVGVPILLLMIAAWWGLAAFEHQLAVWLLRMKMPPMCPHISPKTDLWEKIKAHFKNPVTWKSLAYLFVKFPLGIFSFVLVVTLLSVSIAMMLPVFSIFIFPVKHLVGLPLVIISLMGLLLLIASLHIFNGLAKVSGHWARMMLSIEFIQKKIEHRKKAKKKPVKKKKTVKKKTSKRKVKKKKTKKRKK